MHKPMGTARDPLPPEHGSSIPRTPGLSWVIGGFVAICLAVALAQGAGVQQVAERMAAAANAHG